MRIERVPEFICSPDYEDIFVFHKDGRFIFTHRHKSNSTPTFIVYDILFNKYIQLNADDSVCGFNNGPFNLSKQTIRVFLPVEVNTVLVVLEDWKSRSILIALLRFDLAHGSYALSDAHSFSNCYNSELVTDPPLFGLFYLSICKDGRLAAPETNMELEIFVFQSFSIESEKIKFGEQKELKYDHYRQPNPKNLHLRLNYLWFVRDKKFTPPVHRDPARALPASPTAHYVYISYFDLDAPCPFEIRVDSIKEAWLPDLQWTPDSMFVLSTANELVRFDLQHLKWRTIKTHVFNPSTTVDMINDEWVIFSGPDTEYRNNRFQFSIDNSLVFTTIQRNSTSIDRNPLRSPSKLMEIAWFCALNCNLLDNNAVNTALPYSRVF